MTLPCLSVEGEFVPQAMKRRISVRAHSLDEVKRGSQGVPAWSLLLLSNVCTSNLCGEDSERTYIIMRKYGKTRETRE